MERGVCEGVFPGGVLLVARGNEELFFKAVGVANLYTGIPVGRSTVFDLASLTKPLATTLAVMRLITEKKIDLSAPLARNLPELAEARKSEITWRHLLCHTSGLPAYRPFYRRLLNLAEADRNAEMRRLLIAEPLLHEAGSKTVYSDVGFLLLQSAVEVVAGMPLDRFVMETIYGPRLAGDLFFIRHRDKNCPERLYAATERCPARGVLNGIVHDENAFALGGVGGHAGLFGTVDGVYRLLRQLMAEHAGNASSYWFGRAIVSHFFSKPADAERAVGFDVPSPEGSSSGRYFDRHQTVGHLGFTGTSFWMELGEGISVILLTNRIHPSRLNERIKLFRPALHDAVIRCVKSMDRKIL